MTDTIKAAFITGCLGIIGSIASVFIGDYHGAQDTITQINMQIKSGIVENENLSINNVDDLINGYNKLVAENAELKKYNISHEEYSNLQQSYNELEDQYAILEKQNISLTKENELLRTSNDKWQAEQSSVNSEISNPEPTPKQISIRNVSEFYSDGIEHSKYTITDNIGESYEGYTYMAAGDFFVDSEGSVVYRNDNQYNRFYGRVIISQSEKSDSDCGWIKIYGDDNLLFDTGTMGRGIVPIDFDFDISMYSEIKIDFKDGGWSNDSLQYPKCYLVNTYFEVKDDS